MLSYTVLEATEFLLGFEKLFTQWVSERLDDKNYIFQMVEAEGILDDPIIKREFQVLRESEMAFDELMVEVQKHLNFRTAGVSSFNSSVALAILVKLLAWKGTEYVMFFRQYGPADNFQPSAFLRFMPEDLTTIAKKTFVAVNNKLAKMPTNFVCRLSQGKYAQTVMLTDQLEKSIDPSVNLIVEKIVETSVKAKGWPPAVTDARSYK